MVFKLADITFISYADFQCRTVVQQEFKAMKSYIQQYDAVAIQNENYWWHIILEQVADDIL